MFKNTRMFSSGSNATSLIASRINIKAVLLTLMMLVVAFAGLSFSTGSIAHAATSTEGRAVFLPGKEFNAKIKTIAGNRKATNTTQNTSITSIQRSDTLKNTSNKVSTTDSDVPIYVWFEVKEGTLGYSNCKGDIYWYTEDPHPLLNKEASSMFENLRGVSNIDIASYCDTSNVTDMSYMFNDCSDSLASLNVSNFNTSNVTSMSYMFDSCYKLTSLDVSHFDTSNVTNMRSMFGGCYSLTTLDVSNFNTSNVTNMANMFSSCSGLTSLDVSHFNTSNVTDMSYMFLGCRSLTSLNVSNFDTSNATNMGCMFNACSGLTSLNVSNFNTSNVTDMSHMFYNCSSLPSLDVSNFDTSKVTDMSHMFNDCRSLASLNVSNFNTSNVTDMSYMFNDCRSLTNLDVSSFNTSNVTNMGSMFEKCANLKTIYVSSQFDTTSVTSSSEMFLFSSLLVGGNGTTYDGNHYGVEYARIDVQGTPGYFTDSSEILRNVTIDSSNSIGIDAISNTGEGKCSGKNDWTGVITLSQGYSYPASIQITVGRNILPESSYAYDKETGTITIPKEQITGNISIQANAEKLYHNISVDTTNSSGIDAISNTGNDQAYIKEDWTGVITPSQGYVYPKSIQVTVGENVLPSSAYTYDKETGTITIPKEQITGNILIQANGESSSDHLINTGAASETQEGGVDVYIPVTKVMQMDSADATILDNYTFTMTADEAAHTQDAYKAAHTVSNKVMSPAPTDNGVQINAAGFNAIATLTENSKTVVSNNATNVNNTNDTFHVHFDKDMIGQFHYRVVENPVDGLQSGVTLDTNTYDVCITIDYKNGSDINSGEVKCSGVTVAKLDSEGNFVGKTNQSESSMSDRGGAGADIHNVVFTNTMKTANVKVDKVVRGALGDKTKDFTFVFNTAATGNIPTSFKMYKTDANGVVSADVVNLNATNATFTLKHGESALITGLPAGITHQIIERGNADYTTTIDYCGEGSQEMVAQTVNGGTNQTDGSNIGIDQDGQIAFKAVTNNSNVDQYKFTNAKGALIPTGILENAASFMGLALIAAFAIGYMIYKKKKDTVSEEA